MALLNDITIIQCTSALTCFAWFITPHPNTVCPSSHFDDLITCPNLKQMMTIHLIKHLSAQHTHAVGSSIRLLRLCQALAPVLCDPDAVYAAQSIPTGHRLLHAPSSTASQPIMPHHLIWASVSLYYTTFADNVTSHITLRSNYGTFKGRCVGGSAEVERLLHNMKQSCGKALKDFCGRLYVQYVGIVNCSDVSCAKRGEFSVCVK